MREEPSEAEIIFKLAKSTKIKIYFKGLVKLEKKFGKIKKIYECNQSLDIGEIGG